MKELAPLLNVEKLSSEFTISENEMYVLIMTNFDELESFLNNLKFIKDNQNVLDFDIIKDLEEKKKAIKPLELKGINLYSNINQIHESVDRISENYSKSVDILNDKIFIYNELLEKMIKKQKA